MLGTPHRLSGLVLAAVLVAGGFGSLVALTGPSGERWRSTLDIAGVLDGRATAGLAALLTEQSPWSAPLAQIDSAVRWLAAGDLGPWVRRGCDNWLFLTDELVPQRNGAAEVARRAQLANAAGSWLARRGIGLVVVPVPDKSRIEAAHLCGLTRAAVVADRYPAFLAGLDPGRAVPVDLGGVLAGLDGARYFRTDTHWNERGAEAAAQAVAAALRRQGWAPTPGTPPVRAHAPSAERVGDLLRLAGLDRVPALWRPAGDWVSETRVAPIAAGGDDLLGDGMVPTLVVVGSSFARTAGFVGFLTEALAAPVADLSRDGSGFAGALIAYLQSPAFTETPPRAIIWEMPERSLELPPSPEEQAWAAVLRGEADLAQGISR